jgi:hypothetical protein
MPICESASENFFFWKNVGKWERKAWTRVCRVAREVFSGDIHFGDRLNDMSSQGLYNCLYEPEDFRGGC